jgi:excisionase family DNA binding protein
LYSKNFYTVDEAAGILKLTPSRIRRMLRGGDLEGSKEPGDRGWRITRESVEEVRRPRHPPRERGGATEDRGDLVETLRREDEYLRRQLDQATERDRENRRLLLAAALERIPPQLEAPAEERESDIGDAPTHPTEVAAGPQTETSQLQRCILRRLFGR